jgi:hypothetical protein
VCFLFSSFSSINIGNDRLNSAEVVHEYGRRMYNMDASHWLAQANDIFNRLDMTWGFEDFGICPVSPSSTSIAHSPQSQYMLSTTGSSFQYRQTIHLPATSSCARWPSSKQRTRHASEFPTGQRIGLSTHWELTDSALRPQKTWDFL